MGVFVKHCLFEIFCCLSHIRFILPWVYDDMEISWSNHIILWQESTISVNIPASASEISIILQLNGKALWTLRGGTRKTLLHPPGTECVIFRNWASGARRLEKMNLWPRYYAIWIRIMHYAIFEKNPGKPDAIKCIAGWNFQKMILLPKAPEAPSPLERQLGKRCRAAWDMGNMPPLSKRRFSKIPQAPSPSKGEGRGEGE